MPVKSINFTFAEILFKAAVLEWSLYLQPLDHFDVFELILLVSTCNLTVLVSC